MQGLWRWKMGVAVVMLGAGWWNAGQGAIAVSLPSQPIHLAQSSSQSFIGLQYKSAGTPTKLAGGATVEGGWIVAENAEQPPYQFGISRVLQGTNQMLWFERFLKNDQSGITLKVIDAVDIPRLKRTETLLGGSRGCQLNGRDNAELIAIVPSGTTEFITQIRHVWRANRKTQKIEKISPRGIRCRNSSWGV
jgi:hypothetical protein